MTSTDQPDHLPGTSTNERAEQLLGRRETTTPDGRGIVVLFEPVEQDYMCPVHQRTLDQEHEQQTLFWSEYRAFLWCELCDKDYPSALCCADLDRAIEVFLDTVRDAQERAGATR